MKAERWTQKYKDCPRPNKFLCFGLTNHMLFKSQSITALLYPLLQMQMVFPMLVSNSCRITVSAISVPASLEKYMY